MPWIVYLSIFGFIMYFAWRVSKSGGGGGTTGPSLFTFGKSRGQLVAPDASTTTFADVAGCDEAKAEVKELISFLKNPERFHRLGAHIPRGVMLVGPPGTGKTLLARAVAGEAGVPFIAVSGSEFDEMLVGVGAARVRDLFKKARESAPCIIFIDELDALGRSRGSGIGGKDDQTLNQLLVEMDGFAEKEAVVVIAATNRPEILDLALLRPGRFDRQVAVDVPDRVGRLAILEVHARRVPLADDVDLTEMAKITPGFAGADLRNLINEAAIVAARDDLDQVNQQCFRRAIDRVVAGLEKKNLLLTDEEKLRTAYHEVGHALAYLLAGGDNNIIHKITIIPRGRALGFTMMTPERETYSYTEPALQAQMVGLLGGRAAEELVYSGSSTGDQNDLERATDLARAMVVDYGMSEEVGPVSVSSRRQPTFLQGRDGPVGVSRQIGDGLADTIDREVRRFVEEALTTARELLKANRESLDKISETLVEHEVLDGDRLQDLMREARAAHDARVN